VAEGEEKVPPQSIIRTIKLMIRRRLSPKKERAFKTYTNDLAEWFFNLVGRKSTPPPNPIRNFSSPLEAGDSVKVRPLKEIAPTLNHWGQLRGCTFMPEMAVYCGTTQRVLKPMNRFVDERDLRVKRSKGIILLEGVMCQGTAAFGSCDRSCFVFWREEWLEKTEEKSA
jgi:hypothetical protein